MKRIIALAAALALTAALAACADTSGAYNNGTDRDSGYGGNVSTTTNGYVNGTNRTLGTSANTGRSANTDAMGAGMRG